MSKDNYIKLHELQKIFPQWKDDLEVQAEKGMYLKTLMSMSKTGGLVLSLDGMDTEGRIQSLFYNEKDYKLVVVFIDDDGHTRVIDNIASLKKFKDEIGAEDNLFIAHESAKLKQWQKVSDRYLHPIHREYNALAMLDRLVELGEGL